MKNIKGRLGCTDTNALNPDPIATVDDGSCAYPPPSYHGLEAELIAEVGGVYTHRVYASFSNPLDELVAVFGNDEQPLSITSGSFFTQDSEGISGFGTPDEINAPAPDSWLALGSAGSAVQTIGMAVDVTSVSSASPAAAWKRDASVISR